MLPEKISSLNRARVSAAREEGQGLIHDSGNAAREDVIVIPTTKADIAMLINTARERYEANLKKYMPPNASPRIDFATALAVMHAIDEKTQTGWEPADLYFANAATSVALQTAGFTNAKDSVAALLNGATGDSKSLLASLLPSDAGKALSFASRIIVGSAHIGNIARVAGILRDERKTEDRLQKLFRLQQRILSDPGRTRALLAILNNATPDAIPNAVRSIIPQVAETALTRISPFSLEDMQTVVKLFDAVEDFQRSKILTEAQRIALDSFLARLRAAGLNLGRVTGSATASVTETMLLFTGNIIGGAVGGLALGANELARQLYDALNQGKARWGDVPKGSGVRGLNIKVPWGNRAKSVPSIVNSSFRPVESSQARPASSRPEPMYHPIGHNDK